MAAAFRADWETYWKRRQKQHWHTRLLYTKKLMKRPDYHSAKQMKIGSLGCFLRPRKNR